ncbi:hypothetical protein [Hyphomicrobium sp.]|uniref:hypothetical protein n=1 Tax=Hyphomicrobium sp. TaxID=82 RepID=UPI0025BADB5D|nr:hypothetical protein [Hyphomicrobium sp.]MCC7254121.1 hypothetical protein [Hyphomicrobium sp.]
MIKTACITAAVVLGIAATANGTLMLVNPERWYLAVPGVTTTGPFNQHFVRDIGLVFLLVGGSFLLGAARPHIRVAFWAIPSIWLSGHALFHFWEVAVGICGPSALARDFPAVTLPAVIGLCITGWAMAEARQATSVTVAKAS